MIDRLPADLLVVIRDCLFDILDLDKDISIWVVEKSLEKYLRFESRWSWRNFVSTGNTSNWKAVRKATMVWDLNYDYSRKYLVDTDFQNYIQKQMLYPEQQLQLKLSQIERKIFSKRGVPVALYTSSEITDLNLLHTLTIADCANVTSLGDFKTLRTLRISNSCENLISVGEMPHLRELVLYSVPVKAVSLFPLDNLLKLNISFLRFIDEAAKGIQYMANSQEKLLSLQELRLNRKSTNFFATEVLSLPSLVALDLCGFHSIDLMNFPRLKSFAVRDTVAVNIKGKEIIYPKLESLSCSLPDEFIETNIKQFKNLKKLHYLCSSAALVALHKLMDDINSLPSLTDLTLLNEAFPPYETNIQLNGKLRYLHLQFPMKSIELLNEDKSVRPRPLLQLSMDARFQSFHELSKWQNISALNLHFAFAIHTITDFLGTARYLSLSDCLNVQSFSCFRNLYYLEIIENNHLNDEDVAGFGNIYCLSLSLCHSITRISGLTNNKFVSFCNLSAVKEMEFQGRELLHVRLIECRQLSVVNITGWIENLEIWSCPDVEKEELQNYETIISE
jgi:hypothetical protein